MNEPISTSVLHAWEYEETYTNRFMKWDFTVTGSGDAWYWRATYCAMEEKQGTATSKEAAMLDCDTWFKGTQYYARSLEAGKKLLAMLDRLEDGE